MKEFKFELVINEYPINAIVSKSKNPKYYSNKPGRGRKHMLPKKLEKEGYTIDLDGFYLNLNGERVISNTRTVGKPGTIPINAQIFYVGKPFQRMAVKNFLKALLTPLVVSMEKIDYPLIIKSEVYAPYEHKLPDMNNIGYAWEKILTDVMVENNILVDDDPLYVTHPGSAPLYTPIDNFKDRKLVFKFYHDKRIEIAKARQLYLNI